MSTMTISIIATLLGFLTHTGKQMITSRATAGRPLTLAEYLSASWIETFTAASCSAGLFLAYPEIGSWFPGLGMAANLPTTQTPFGGFVCGFIGNSLADMLGGRITQIVNGPNKGD